MLVKVKILPSGEEDKVKARAVLRGDQMVSGRDYGEVFAPTAQLTSVRCVTADAGMERARERRPSETDPYLLCTR